MYKLAIKFLIITLVMTGVCLVWSSNGKALAATTSCPSGDSAPADWGNDSDGEGAGVMSSLIMKARDTSGNLMNPHFTLQSQAPGWSDNAQIYHWPIGSGGSVSNTDQWPQHGDFQFGTHLSGDGGISCNGWVALGPGINGNVGNGWVLNCKNPSGNNNYFWISHVDNPTGQDGTWELLDSGGNSIDSNINSGSSPHIHFPVTNGANMRFTLVWHPKVPPTPHSDAHGTCTYFTATGSKYVRKEVHITGVSSGQGKSDWDGNTWTHGADFDEYTPAAVGNNVSPGSYQKEWWYRPTANIIHVTVNEWDYDSATNTWPETTNSYDKSCYSATCSIDWVDGDGPWNGTYNPDGSPHFIVVANGAMHIHGTFSNTSPAPDSLDMLAGAYLDGPNGANNLGFVAYAGDSHSFEIDSIRAPGSVTTYGATFTPQYNGSESNMSGCSMSAPVYQDFSASVSALSDLKPTTEHPNQGDDYKASITVRNGSSHSVNIPTNSLFYFKPAGGGQSNIASNSGGTYASSPSGTTTNTLAGHYDVPPGYQAGDEYCAHIHANYTTGFVGPSGDVVNPGNPADSTSCPRIANEPYFKVFNSSVSAGGAFDQCTTDGGTLAGYADISDPPGATRGSSSQLSALALVKITGFASGQSPGSINGSPTKLSFANTGVQVDSGGNESPVLGGQFGGCRTLTNETAPPSATNFGGVTFPISGKNGAYKHSGNLRINGGTLAANQNVSMFVNGDAYVSSNIIYGNGWQAGTAPSLVIHATGNIYIAQGVTRLAGIYIAQNNLYTCANGFAPVQPDQLYASCKNQLMVTGSFVAKQVNLMRSFGSLRDEEPKPGTPGGATENVQWSSCGSYGNPVGGESCLPASGQSGLRCINTNEPSENPAAIWADNVLCVPNSSTLHLAWTHYDNSPYSDPRQDPGKNDSGMLNEDYWKSLGYKYCTKWNAGDPDTWQDNEICMDHARSDGSAFLHFVSSPTPGESCITISELSDNDGQWKSGYFLCQPSTAPSSPTPKGPPFTSCSNMGTEIDPKACAGEIFEFSPTLYLSSPTVNPPGGGSLQFQSITSLPPVL